MVKTRKLRLNRRKRKTRKRKGGKKGKCQNQEFKQKTFINNIDYPAGWYGYRNINGDKLYGCCPKNRKTKTDNKGKDCHFKKWLKDRKQVEGTNGKSYKKMRRRHQAYKHAEKNNDNIV